MPEYVKKPHVDPTISQYFVKLGSVGGLVSSPAKCAANARNARKRWEKWRATKKKAMPSAKPCCSNE